MDLMVMIGVPGSGKSFYAKNKILSDSSWIRVNKDDIRLELNQPWSKQLEKQVIAIEDSQIEDALKLGKNVIVDDTNLNKFHLNERFIPLASKYSANLIVNKEFMKTPIEVCIERDSKREGKAHVGEEVIRSMFKLYSKWGREDTYWLDNIEKNKDKEKVFLFDLDGNLSYATNRSYYEEERCVSDKPNIPVVIMLNALYLSGMRIIFVSGRKDKAWQQSYDWIVKHTDVKDPQIFMRKTSDDRSDDIIKEEIYKNNIEPFFNVIGISDDRPRVCKKWKELGLFVFHTYQGTEDF